MAAAYLKAPGFFVQQRCTKVPFASRRMALAAMADVARKPRGITQHGSGDLNVYKCPLCRKLHIGHRPVRAVAALLFFALALAFGAHGQTASAPPGIGGVYHFGTVTGTGVLGVPVFAGTGESAPSAYTLAWRYSGTAPAACTFYPQGSLDGRTWYTLATASQTSTAPLDCTAPAMVHFSYKPVLYFRVLLMTYSAGDSTTAVSMDYLRGTR